MLLYVLLTRLDDLVLVLHSDSLTALEHLKCT